MTIHTALVAEQSPTLRNLAEGFMEKAQTGTVIWEDGDEDNFTRFAQFVYTGDYTPPSCNTVDNPQRVSFDGITDELTAAAVFSTEEPEPNPDLGLSNKKLLKERKRARYIIGSVPFYDLVYSPPTSSNVSEIRKPRPFHCSTEDYTPVLLGHARLYVFAEKYGIKNLRAMVLHKLHSTIC